MPSWKLPKRLLSRPYAFAVVDKGRRRAGVRWFPYGLFFLVEETRAVVIASFMASATRSAGNSENRRVSGTERRLMPPRSLPVRRRWLSLLMSTFKNAILTFSFFISRCPG